MKALMLGIALAGLLLSGSAQAGTSSFAGTLQLTIADLQPAIVNTFGVATLNQGQGGTHVTTLTVPGSTSFTETISLSTTVKGLASFRVTGHVSSGAFGPILPGSSASTLQTLTQDVIVPGRLILCNAGCTASITLTARPGDAGFTATASGTLASPINVTVQNANWTVLTATASTDNGTTIVTAQRFGFAHGPASAASSVALGSPDSHGVLQFVTPTQITTDLGGGAFQHVLKNKIAMFHSKHHKFVPEPGMTLMLLSGAAGLMLLGRRRMKK